MNVSVQLSMDHDRWMDGSVHVACASGDGGAAARVGVHRLPLGGAVVVVGLPVLVARDLVSPQRGVADVLVGRLPGQLVARPALPQRRRPVAALQQSRRHRRRRRRRTAAGSRPRRPRPARQRAGRREEP
jgi:hypothetical protein